MKSRLQIDLELLSFIAIFYEMRRIYMNVVYLMSSDD